MRRAVVLYLPLPSALSLIVRPLPPTHASMCGRGHVTARFAGVGDTLTINGFAGVPSSSSRMPLAVSAAA